MAEIKEFLNPKSMLTPGIAGGTTMVIAGTLWVQFGLPQKWTALIISFAFGLLVFSELRESPIWQRPIFYVLNSLIIFSVGAGANSIGSQAQHTKTSNLMDYLVSPARAEATRDCAFLGKEAKVYCELLKQKEAQLKERQQELSDCAFRLDVVSEQITNLMKLNELKDDQLARLQAGLSYESSEKAIAEPVEAEEAIAEAVIAEEVEAIAEAVEVIAEEAIAEAVIAEAVIADPVQRPRRFFDGWF